ncbi:MAG TPA: HPr family phosphocarrier protein [Chloroflexota bacterium]|nr:HPr family phosphocarrier protein [Chloroflexota bacterium]
MAEPDGSGPAGQARPVEATVVLRNQAGLHARSGAALVKTAARFDARVTLQLKAQSANARSLMDLLRLGARQGDGIQITATGPDATAAVEAIAALMEHGFGEE